MMLAELWWNARVMQNPVSAWGALLGVLLVAMVMGKLVAAALDGQVKRLQAYPNMRLPGIMLASASKPAQLVIFAVGLYMGQTMLNLDAQVRTVWVQIARAVGVAAAVWFIYRLVDIVAHLMRGWTSKTMTVLDDLLVPLLRKALLAFILIIAALFIAENIFDLHVNALIVGVGIGGLAVALAAKESLANLFGSVVIFGDKPFTLGDRIAVKGYDGTVEEVGFRSTRLRTGNGNLVVIPNSIISSESVENFSRRPTIPRSLGLTIATETPPDKVLRAVEILRQMLDAQEQLPPG